MLFEDNGLSTRINELESLLAHLQYDLEKMSSVIIEQKKEIDDLKRQITRLDQRIDNALSEPEDNFSVE